MLEEDWIDYLLEFREKYKFHEALLLSEDQQVITVRYDHKRSWQENRYIPFIYDGKQVVIQNETK